MRADLGWSYLTAGTMNTVNALGYLVGALLVPRLLRQRFAARRCCWPAVPAAAAAAGRARPGAAADAACCCCACWPAWPAPPASSAAACSPRSWVGTGRYAARAAAERSAGAGAVLRRHGAGDHRLGRRGAAADRAWHGRMRGSWPGAPGRGGAAGDGADGGAAHARCRRRRCAAGGARATLRAATPSPSRLARLPDVRPGLHRLHDLHHHAAARTGHGARRRWRCSTCCSASAWWPRPGCGPGCCSATAAALPLAAAERRCWPGHSRCRC